MLLDDLIPMAHMEAPAAPYPVIRYHLIMAARDLCSYSLAWQDEVTIALDGSDTYTLTPPAGVLVEPISALFSSGDATAASYVRLEPTTIARLDATDPSWRVREGTPRWFQLDDYSTIRFVPVPSTGTITLRVALQPDITAAVIDDRVGQTYRDTLVHGALARLFRSPVKDLFNGSLAAYHEEKFEIGKGNAQVRGVDGFVKPVRRVRYGGL